MILKNNAETFPELNIEHLLRYAKRWVSIVPGLPIRKIELYRYSPFRFELYYNRIASGSNSKNPVPLVSTKFAVVFNFYDTNSSDDNCNSLPSKRFKDFVELTLNSGSGTDDDLALEKRFKEFVALTQYYSTIKEFYFGFMDQSFGSTVYKAAANENFIWEWLFIPKLPDLDLPANIICDEPYWILWENEAQSTESIPHLQKVEEESTDTDNVKDSQEVAIQEPKTDREIHQNATKNNAFILQGDFWNVQYNCESKNFRDLTRLRYIIRLLENPNKKFSHIELQGLVSGTQPEIEENYSKMSDEELEAEGFRKDLQTDKLSDEERDNIEDLVHKNWGDIDLMPKISRHVFNEYGVRVSSNSKCEPFFQFKTRLTDDAEKARVNATKHIHEALKDFKVKFPALHFHLQNRIHTDGTCRYECAEADDPRWAIQWNN
jgi:hypothetical protein